MMEVRCGCMPEKVLGWLPAPRSGEFGMRRSMDFVGQRIPWWSPEEKAAMRPAQYGLPQPVWFRLTLHVEFFSSVCYGERLTWAAYTSDEVPLERLRSLTVFRENTWR